MHEFVYVLLGLLMGYITAFVTQKAKNDALKKDSAELALLKERGKNLATKEDIQEITELQESVKTTFQLEMEKQKTELSKISKEFELYVVKKHEHYPELYKNIELCIGKVTGLRGKVRGIDFRNANKEDITRYMTEKHFTELDKERICSNWDNNKQQAIRDLNHRLEEINYNEANEYYKTAHNFYLLHRLFFSDEVSIKSRELLDKIFELWFNYDPDFAVFGDPALIVHLNEEGEIFKSEIESLRDALFRLLQEELKAGTS